MFKWQTESKFYGKIFTSVTDKLSYNETLSFLFHMIKYFSVLILINMYFLSECWQYEIIVNNLLAIYVYYVTFSAKPSSALSKP